MSQRSGGYSRKKDIEPAGTYKESGSGEDRAGSDEGTAERPLDPI